MKIIERITSKLDNQGAAQLFVVIAIAIICSVVFLITGIKL